jgi:hypothetical protein
VTFIALIKFADVAIGLRLCVRTDEPTVSGKIDHPARSLSDMGPARPGLAKCRPVILTQGEAVAV